MEFNPRKQRRGNEEVSQEELKIKKEKQHLKPWSDVNGICIIH